MRPTTTRYNNVPPPSPMYETLNKQMYFAFFIHSIALGSSCLFYKGHIPNMNILIRVIIMSILQSSSLHSTITKQGGVSIHHTVSHPSSPAKVQVSLLLWDYENAPYPLRL